MSAKTVASFARELKISEKNLSGYLKELGVSAKSDDVLDDETVAVIKDLIKEQKSVKVQIPQAITVRELAEKLGKSAGELQKSLVELGILATVNQSIGADVAQKVAEKWHITLEIVKSEAARP
ncbi:MAG: translation initiation factor IF-2 N-terminal domain-containing protein, partial [Abditibacteriota bacterium]|nr:translation initiation factor IF-2 N-terminal domain-containing protein [Abditibacteriota bacterium]